MKTSSTRKRWLEQQIKEIGPGFAEALRAMGRLEAERTVALIQEYRARVQRILMGSHRTEINRLDDIDAILEAVTHIDGRAYDFSAPCGFRLCLYISADEFISVRFSFHRPSESWAEMPNPPLPAPLWGYYVRDCSHP
jgi:hypothetical protein